MGNTEKIKVRTYDDRGTFAISYNPLTDAGEETAVVIGNEFLILLGDYRDEYTNVKTVRGARTMFHQLQVKGAEVSPWSN